MCGVAETATKEALYCSGSWPDAAAAWSCKARARRFCRKAPTIALARTPPSSWIVLTTPDATPPRWAGMSRVARLKIGVQMKPMPRPLTMRPGTKSQRPELACAAQSMYPLPAASASRPGTSRYLPLTFWLRPAATPEVSMVVNGWIAIVRPEAMAPSRAEVGNDEHRERQDDDADRKVDGEDRAPAEVAHEHAADGGAGDHGKPRDRSVDREHPAAPVGREQGEHERQALRRDHRGSESLKGAGHDQLRRVLGESAQA